MRNSRYKSTSQFVKKSQAFTLLEIMIAVVILSLMGAFTAIHIKKLIDEQRFETEVSALFITLQEAQVLASAYQTDIALDFYRKEGKLYYRFSSDEPFTPHQLKQKEKALKYTSLLQFKDKKTNKLRFDIFSGRIEPRGMLAFFQTQQENSKVLWFDLQYGQLLKFSYHKPTPSKQQVPTRA